MEDGAHRRRPAEVRSGVMGASTLPRSGGARPCGAASAGAARLDASKGEYTQERLAAAGAGAGGEPRLPWPVKKKRANFESAAAGFDLEAPAADGGEASEGDSSASATNIQCATPDVMVPVIPAGDDRSPAGCVGALAASAAPPPLKRRRRHAAPGAGGPDPTASLLPGVPVRRSLARAFDKVARRLAAAAAREGGAETPAGPVAERPAAARARHEAAKTNSATSQQTGTRPRAARELSDDGSSRPLLPRWLLDARCSRDGAACGDALAAALAGRSPSLFGQSADADARLQLARQPADGDSRPDFALRTPPSAGATAATSLSTPASTPSLPSLTSKRKLDLPDSTPTNQGPLKPLIKPTPALGRRLFASTDTSSSPATLRQMR